MITVRAACAVLAATLVVSLYSSPLSWAAATPTPVLTGPLNQDFPGASPDWLEWDSNSKKKPHHYNAYFEWRAGGAVTQVNASGTFAYHPDMQAGSNWIVYQQVNPDQTVSGIYRYDPLNGGRYAFRLAGRGWKYWPVASSHYLVWMQIVSKGTRTHRKLEVLDRKNGHSFTIASVPASCAYCLEPDWAGKSHIVYSSCTKNTGVCNLEVWDAANGSIVHPPKDASPVSQYGGALDEATMTLYYVRSTNNCGLNVSVERWNVDANPPIAPEDLYDEPEGIDMNGVRLAPDVSTPSDLDLFTVPYDCLASNPNSDIYLITSVNQIP